MRHTMEKTKTLGILGGIGPLASVYFADTIVNMTLAEKDQDHLPFFMYNNVFIPDRTDYILKKTDVNPLPFIIQGMNKLEDAGCDFAVMTCNTAHYFYDEIQSAVNIPIINMIESTVKYTAEKIPSVKKIGVLATDGTIQSGVYKKVIESNGFECVTPCEDSQSKIMDIIYNQVKAGKTVDFEGFMKVIQELRNKGCNGIILGCTELSVINRDNDLTQKNNDIIDAMQALARECITLCGKKIKE